jgi:hypothetical protein
MPHLFHGACALVLLVAGCSDSGSDAPTCPPPGPTFRLTLTAAAGPLPGDTSLEVRYGGGTEPYPPLASKPPQSVFCHAGADAGADASATIPDAGADALVCDLWTNGPATVEVRAQGYPDLSQSFVPTRDECGIHLTLVDMELEKGD